MRIFDDDVARGSAPTERRSPRVLYVRTRGRLTASHRELQQSERDGHSPRRALIEDAFGFDLIDESNLLKIPGWWGAILRRLPSFVALAFEVVRLRREYDVVVSWSEKHTVAIAALLAFRRRRPRHMALMFWISKPAVRIPLRFFRGGVDRIVTWSSVQRDVAVNRVGFRPADVLLVCHPVDQAFFVPYSTSTPDILFSAGSTQRDFPTLIDAVEDMRLPLRIAASIVVSLRRFRVSVTDARDLHDLPSHITIGPMNWRELRDSYAAARVVVVPLLPSDMDAGVSVVLEAMSMGRPIIVTRTAGQIDVVRDGDTGIYVPPQDAVALKLAIERLLADRVSAEAMGDRARKYVLEHHSVDAFAALVSAFARELAVLR